ncbi:mannosyl-oligosaccharide 1,2-alpha-mannosidase [Malassezia yamatoensis]|uniref:alpha-1,2-Mannosidase n=1 Tax=Malassezia yamatoensis TaxID=253288 RepID=A0AAJ5YWQ9_9BASI|nr:mannosyl-oligosaccharide 1,2-alpha-mannosidase [Malassezia yamatoensis]
MYPHPTYSIDPKSNISLSDEAFPPQWSEESLRANSAQHPMYPKGDPHLGEIPAPQSLLLESTPKLMNPPWPRQPAELDPESWTYHPWTRSLNGSKTHASDAERPNSQDTSTEWRPPPFNKWKPPLAALRRASYSLPPIQFAFPSPDRHSGQANDRGRDAMIAERQRMVRSAFIRSWQAYKQYAWGADEIRPITMQPNNNFNGWGATIVDALDTLLVLDLHEEYNLARRHVYDIDFHYVGGERSAYNSHDGRVPVFETAIRYLGGFLAAYDLTKDALMLDRAEELAQLILPAFDTLTGLPVGRIRFDQPTNHSHPIGRHKSVVLAEATSMLMEFTRLWQVTGNRTYFDRVQRITDYIDTNLTIKSELGSLMTTQIFPEQQSLGGKYTFGGQADSYYEYLIKQHQLLGNRLPQYARMYSAAIDDAMQYLIKDVHVVPHAPSLAVFTETYGPKARYEPKLEHLSCFAGGMLALGSKLLPNRELDLNIARRFTETCWWAYNTSFTGIGPEELSFFRPHDTDRYTMVDGPNNTKLRGDPKGNPQTGVRGGIPAYLNRPETIESIFYMYRITGDPIWQDRGWQMFASWTTHGLVPTGISSIANVHRVPTIHTDSTESFTFAETFKYYYLLFSPPNVISLDDFVFTTEAHPFLAPKNKRYAQAGDIPKNLRTWVPPPGCDLTSVEYSGGECLLKGGLTNTQKHDLNDRWLHRNDTSSDLLDIPEDVQQTVRDMLNASRDRVATKS